MRTLYLEPFSGLAGDMLLAALLDLGDPRFTLDDLRALAERLVPGESRITLETAWRGNLSGKLLSIETSETHVAPHRGYADLERIVRAADLAPRTAERALAVLWRIAEAEGRVHGCAPEEIHFHEVGAVDTLIDVCGAAFALDRLGVEEVLSGPPVTGTGTVRCAHGEMPVPAPAVVELLRGKPMSISGGGGERLTPTGAALLAELVARFEPPGGFVPERVGYGAGRRDPKEGPPNVLRVQLGERVEAGAREGSTAARVHAWLAEVNLDDMTGEELAHAARSLRDAGALDVWTAPVWMKKERPGVVLSFLCREDQRAPLESALFDHTTTLGLRWIACERTECARSELEVELAGERIRVKVRERPARAVSERDLSPEHDDLARASAALGLSLREVERRAIDAALGELWERRRS